MACGHDPARCDAPRRHPRPRTGTATPAPTCRSFHTDAPLHWSALPQRPTATPEPGPPCGGATNGTGPSIPTQPAGRSSSPAARQSPTACRHSNHRTYFSDGSLDACTSVRRVVRDRFLAESVRVGPRGGEPGRPAAAHLLEEIDHVGRVADAVVLVAVVHEHVHLAGALRELLDPLHPRTELTAVVEVLESLGRGCGVRLPGLVGAAVETNDGEIGGGRHDGPQAAHLGSVDDDEGEVVVRQERERTIDVVVSEPAGRTELDADRDLAEALPGQR